jgi:hypothetical protein
MTDCLPKWLEDYCARLTLLLIGHYRNYNSPEERVVGFKRRVSVAFVATENQVTILRLFYGGQYWEDKFKRVRQLN